MNPNVLTAAISSGGAVVTAIVALVVNARGFTLLSKRIDDTNTNVNRRIDDLRNETTRRLDRIEADFQEFFKVQVEHDKRLGRIEDKLGIPPH